MSAPASSLTAPRALPELRAPGALARFLGEAVRMPSFYVRCLLMLFTLAFIVFRVPQINIFAERAELLSFGHEPRAVYGSPVILIATVFHAFAGTVAILIGPVQTWRLFHVHFRQMHHALGKIQLGAVLFSTAGGLVISFTAEGGLAARLLLLCGIALWGFTGFKTAWTARQALRFPEGRAARTYWIRRHRTWAFYNYALSLLQPVLYLVLIPLLWALRPDVIAHFVQGTPILEPGARSPIGQMWEIADVVTSSYLIVFLLNVLVAHVYLTVTRDYDRRSYAPAS